MSGTGQVKVPIESPADLLAVAEALEQEAAARYRDLSAEVTRQGDLAMAAQFDALARMEDLHAGQIAERGQALLGRRPDPARVKWEMPPGYDADEARGARLSPYQALAFAVRNEERAFAFFTYVAAEAASAEIRAMAEDLARDELQHAALLRGYRRRAFHQNRPLTFAIPDDSDQLLALERRWEAEADSPRALEELFDRYAFIVEHARDERVMIEAQRLADRTVSRLAAAGGALGNGLLERDAGEATCRPGRPGPD